MPAQATFPAPHQASPKSQMAQPTVYIVDDEPAILSLFEQMLEAEDVQLRTFGLAKDFLAAVDESQPGCLVLDLNLPDLSGLEVLEELARRSSNIPVVFMSGLAKVSEAVSALKLGSLDFVEKPFSIAAMLEAVHRAIEVDRLHRESSTHHEQLRARLMTLTPREREVMDLVVQGLPNKVVASTLGVSPKTVEVHRANVMRKTHSNSLAELVKLVMTVRGD